MDQHEAAEDGSVAECDRLAKPLAACLDDHCSYYDAIPVGHGNDDNETRTPGGLEGRRTGDRGGSFGRDTTLSPGRDAGDRDSFRHADGRGRLRTRTPRS